MNETRVALHHDSLYLFLFLAAMFLLSSVFFFLTKSYLDRIRIGEHGGETVQCVGGEPLGIGQELPDAVKRPEDIRRPVNQIQFRFFRGHNRRDLTTEDAESTELFDRCFIIAMKQFFEGRKFKCKSIHALTQCSLCPLW